MSQIKLAAGLIPLAFLCSVAVAQEQRSDSPPKTAGSSQLKPQSQTASPSLTQSQEDVYGPYVPYVAPAKGTAQPQGAIANTVPVVCDPANTSKSTPLLLQADPVYGPYVPYTGPPLNLTACYTPSPQTASSRSASPNSSPVQPHVSQQEGNGYNQLFAHPGGTAPPPAHDVILSVDSPSPVDDASGASGTSGYVRPVPPPIEIKPPNIRPFRSVAIGFTANTLGAGIELATPVSRSFNLRSSINVFAFDDPFSIDGINYEARLHLKSSETTLDWFPGNRGFHISPGILYVKNTLSAPAFVGPGQTFILGNQSFINSVDDPVSGSASVVYPHTFAPMLLLGYGNIIPRSGRHLSVSIEFGVAYTGAPQISVALNGTACTTNGCVSFAGNPQAQAYVKQEVNILNEDLKKVPIFPIVSLGVAYHF